MWEALTKSAARKFYGGSGFFLLIFVAINRTQL